MQTIPYRNLRDLLDAETGNVRGETRGTAMLIRRLRKVNLERQIKKKDFIDICMWKSARAAPQCRKNTQARLDLVFSRVFSTRNEKRRLESLTSLSGVGIPMASAILMLTDPARYGVIDIRVWRLLYALGSVRTKPRGQYFSFANWFHFLTKIRYYARKHAVSARHIERTLFEYHKKVQTGRLYDS